MGNASQESPGFKIVASHIVGCLEPPQTFGNRKPGRQVRRRVQTRRAARSEGLPFLCPWTLHNL